LTSTSIGVNFKSQHFGQTEELPITAVTIAQPIESEKVRVKFEKIWLLKFYNLILNI